MTVRKMMNDRLIKNSKFLSLILRHKPEMIGLELDEAGWIEVDLLLSAMKDHGRTLTRDELMEIVETNDKKRFALSEDHLRIRASQGHSIPVELSFEPRVPPEILFHGTASHSLPSIKHSGLSRQKRHHVHLSEDEETASNVGRRYGKPALLRVESGKMHAEGYRFYISENGVWLTEQVPVEYIIFPRD